MSKQAEKEPKVFSVMSETGEILRLIEADGVKQVKAALMPNVGKPSTLTVAKLVAGGMKVEKAA